MRMPRTVGQNRRLGFEVAMVQGTQLMINKPHLAPFEVLLWMGSSLVDSLVLVL